MSVSDLRSSYGAKPVLFGIDLTVGKGEVVGIIGHNGAGKTTTIHTIFGTHRPDAGQVSYFGKDITGRKPARNVREGMTMVRAERFTFGDLSVRENLQLASMPIKSAAEREARLERVFSLLPMLKERPRLHANKFSGGQQRLLSLGMALLADPKLIILDEPSLGIAPSLTGRIFDTLKALVEDHGLSVLIVEQNIPHLLRIINRAYVIRSGRVILQESVEQLRARETYWDLF